MFDCVLNTSLVKLFYVLGLKGTLMQFENLSIHSNSYKKISWKFCILNPKNSRVIRPSRLRNVCLQIYRNNKICLKIAYLLRKIQTLPVNNSRITRTKNAKFSEYYFYLNTNIYGDFQIRISVPLSRALKPGLKHRKCCIIEPFCIFEIS